jgi:hypothetical protein
VEATISPTGGNNGAERERTDVVLPHSRRTPAELVGGH